MRRPPFYWHHVSCDRLPHSAGASFNLAYIGDDFDAEHKEDFDQAYMRALYHYAYEKAERGYPWEHAPPGFAGKILFAIDRKHAKHPEERFTEAGIACEYVYGEVEGVNEL